MITKQKPLVSIMIPNFNHSMYLDECVQSALNQTYENTEIIILDNASTDNSVAKASKYIDKRVRVCRNAFNILNTTYLALAMMSKGKYMMMLCADDYIEKSFIEKAVDIMEAYPNVGYVHLERDFITEKGEVKELEPFFNCSFIAPGTDIMPLYMVTTIAHPSQGIFKKEYFDKIEGYNKEIDHMNADKLLWFYLSSVCDYGYIREKMAKIRVGSQTETFTTQKNFQHPVLCHLTIKEMVEFAKKNQLPKVYVRENEALGRLAKDFLNYVAGALAENDIVLAGRYLKYAEIVYPAITKNENFEKLNDMQQGRKEIDRDVLVSINDMAQWNRKRNYEPPENYEKI